MEKTINKVCDYSKILLCLFAVIKSLSIPIMIVSFSVFHSKVFFVNFSIPYLAVSGRLFTLIAIILGWPVSIGLLLNLEKKIWIPSLLTALLSALDIYYCIYHSITVGTINTNGILSVIFNSVIILLSVVYLAVQKSIQKQEYSAHSANN